MRKLVAAAVLMLAFCAQPSAMADTVPTDQTTMLIKLESVERLLSDDSAGEKTAALPRLSLLGMMLLGVIGLFWIRRHTSEL
ncbi:MAG TPA: hypothetical protein VIS76_11330 [Pseudomonadales bacterium]